MPTPKPAARTNDPTEHGGVITGGSEDVLINDRSAARITDYHTCPQTAGGRKHIGGIISEGSSTVVISKRLAARVGDALFCSGPAPAPVVVEEEHCDWKPASKSGYEDKKIGDTRKTKAFLYGVDSKGVCRVSRLVDKSGTSAIGTGRATVDFLKGEGKLQAGFSNDRIKNTGALGIDVGLGGSVIEGKLTGETAALPIPFTDYGISLEGELTGSLGTLEGKFWVGAKWENGAFKFGGKEALGGLVGEGVKVAVVIKPLKPPPAVVEKDLPQDKISKGSPNVFIGG